MVCLPLGGAQAGAVFDIGEQGTEYYALSEKKLNVCGNSASNGMRWKVHKE